MTDWLTLLNLRQSCSRASADRMAASELPVPYSLAATNHYSLTCHDVVRQPPDEGGSPFTKPRGLHRFLTRRVLILCLSMAQRAHDWFRQAEADLRHARNSLKAGDYDWSAFASQQASEKAIKALFQRLHLDAWGHVLSVLLNQLPENVKPTSELVDRAKELDKHYIPTRSPNGFERGAPVDFYTAKEAKEAIANAEIILEFCRNKIS